MSTFPSYCPSSMARITSGAIQYGVPTNEFAGDEIDADPKSAGTVKGTFRFLVKQMKMWFTLHRVRTVTRAGVRLVWPFDGIVQN